MTTAGVIESETAMRDLDDAPQVPPYDSDVLADRMVEALIMGGPKGRQTMLRLQVAVGRDDNTQWAARLVAGAQARHTRGVS